MDKQDRKIMLTTIAQVYNGLKDMGAYDQAKWIGLAYDELCQEKKEKHCKWKYHQEATWKYECPECHCFYPGAWNYCANCGAEMERSETD